MIRQLVPGRPVDLTDRVAVVAVLPGATLSADAVARAVAAALADGADVVVAPGAAAGDLPGDAPVVASLDPLLAVLDDDDYVDLGGLDAEAAVAGATAAVAAGVRVLLTDDVRTVRRAADVAVAVVLAGGTPR